MAGFTEFAMGQILNHGFKAVTWTPPSPYYLALLLTVPSGDTGATTGIVEPSTSLYGYQRVQLPGGALAVANGSLTNTQEIAFPGALDNYPDTVKGTAVMTASSGGSVWAWQLLRDGSGDPAPQVVLAEQVPRIAVGQLHLNRLAVS